MSSRSGDATLRARRFEAVVRPHLDSLYRLAYRFTGRAEDAEDLLQSLMLRLLPHTDTLVGLDRPAPWLARALYNLFVDQHRSRQRQPLDLGHTGDDDDGLDALPAPDQNGPEAAVSRLDRCQYLQQAIDRLPLPQRALIAWHDIEGYTLEELATTHDIPIGTLKSRLHRARARLRRLLDGTLAPAERVEG
nr:RNA polymerase sigma factor [Flagellatimonas centrodinii]